MATDVDLMSKVPKYHELIFPCLKALKALGGSGNNEEILDKACELEKFPPEIQQVQHTDGRQSEIDYRLAWARTYLNRVGAIDNTQRGLWTITEKGKVLTEDDCKRIPAEVRKSLYADRKKKADIRKNPLETDGIDDVEEANWQEQLITVLLNIKPDAFERLAQRILREAGFTKVEVTGKSGDGGIDGIGILRVNLVSFTVLFQCKRYQGSVGAAVIRDFRGAMMGRCDKGLVITTGSFSSDARKEATRDGAPAIDLIDGENLCELLKSLKLGVAIKLVEEIEINSGWFQQL